MALLKDLLVNGVSRLVGDVFLDKLNAPTTSTGNVFGLGTNGLVLKTNGDNIYWGADEVNAGTVTSVLVAATSPVVSSVGTALSSTLSTTISLANGYGDTKNPYASKTKNYVLAAPNGSNGVPSFRALVAADLPTVTVAKGGTGMTTATNKNAVVIGNSTTVTNAMQTVRTASGAFYATGQDAKPLFGTLPVAQGGTGVSTAAANTVLAGPTSGSNAAPSFRKLLVTDIPYGTGIIYCESASNATALTGTINKDFNGSTEDAFLIMFKNDIYPTSANLSSFTFSLNNTTALRIYFGTDKGVLNTSIPKGPLGSILYRLFYHVEGSNKYYVLGDASSFNVTVDSSDNTVSIGYMNDSLLPIALNRPYRLYTSSSGTSFDTEVNHTTTIPLNVTDEQLQSLNFLLITIRVHNSKFYYFPSTSTTGYSSSNEGSFSSYKLVYVPINTGASLVINFENIETRYYNNTYAEIVKSSYIIPVAMTLSDSTAETKNLQITTLDAGKCILQILRVNSVYVSSTNSYSSTNHNSYLTSLISNSDLSIDTVTGI